MTIRNKDRLDALEALLLERGVLHLKEAARLLDVSEMTVRRDISGETSRFAYLGGHIMPAQAVEPEQPYELSHAADQHAVAKRRACELSLAHVRADDTIFVDCGTTMLQLVDLLPKTMPLTVVCYALNTAVRLSAMDNIRLVVLGGLYHAETAAFSDSPGIEMLDRIGINTAFLSAAGLDPTRGATCAHFHEVPVKQKAIAMAQKSLLVIDNSKIGRVKPAFFAASDMFDGIFTEDGIWTPVS
jgi:DeoR family deoxyribose operon repressor